MLPTHLAPFYTKDCAVVVKFLLSNFEYANNNKKNGTRISKVSSKKYLQDHFQQHCNSILELDNVIKILGKHKEWIKLGKAKDTEDQFSHKLQFIYYECDYDMKNFSKQVMEN